MRVISFQDSYQDRTLKEDNYNLLVKKTHGELKNQRGSQLVYEYDLKSLLQKNWKILFLLEKSELLYLRFTNSFIYTYEKA